MTRIHDLDFVPYLSASQIDAEVKRVAAELSSAYRDKNPIFLAVLNGSFMFASDLFKALDFPCRIQFVKMKSYEGTESGTMNTLIGLEGDLANEHIVVVEDIVDTGRTMKKLLDLLHEKQVASLAVCTLLFKKEALLENVPVDYCGFEIPNRFVLGYGLDYDGLGRNLPEILQVNA